VKSLRRDYAAVVDGMDQAIGRVLATLDGLLFFASEIPRRGSFKLTAFDDEWKLSRSLYEWRSQYPIHGTRVHLVPPPGWRAPKDWATYPIPLEELQDEPALGYGAGGFTRRVLDFMHRGRLTYE
jgi:hypothetical protein